MVINHKMPQKYISRHNREQLILITKSVLFYRIEFIQAKTKFSYDYIQKIETLIDDITLQIYEAEVKGLSVKLRFSES